MYDPLEGGYSKEDFQKFINANNIGTLAVANDEWGVHAIAVFYAVEKDLCFLVKSHTGSTHGMDMQKNSRVLLSIYDAKSTYTVKSGAQFRCICERILDRNEMLNAVSLYSIAFPGSDKRFAPLDELISQEAKSTLFRLKVVSAKMLTPDGYSAEFQQLS